VNEWKYDIPDKDYHQESDFVSSSHLKHILKSGKAFLGSYREKAFKTTKAMEFGKAIHLAILEGEKFKDRFVLMPNFGDLRTAKAKEKKKKFIEDQDPNAVLLDEKQYESTIMMLENVLNHKDAIKLLTDGATEVSGYYVDHETGIPCKIRPDFLNFNLNTLVDLKTSDNCSIKAFERAIDNYGYDFQIEMYADGIKQISGQAPRHKAWLVVENVFPHEVAVYTADKETQEIGQMKYREALRRLRESIDKNTWTGYQQRVQEIGLPYYAKQQFNVEDYGVK
jgi:translation elongation factor P/translation initiation factor 5A